MLPPLPGSDGPLRPMRVGELLGTVASVYRANARTVIPVAALITVPAYLLTVLLARALTPLAERLTSPNALAPGGRLDAAVLGDVASAVALSFAGVALDQLAISLVAAGLALAVGRPGEPARRAPTALGTLARLSPRVVPMVALVLLALLGLLLVWVLFQLPLALLLGASMARGGGPGAFVALLAAVGVVAAAIFVLVRLSLGSAVLALEDVGPAVALARSWRLVSGQTWRVLGYGILVGVIVLILDLALVQSAAAVVSVLAPGAVTAVEVTLGAIAQALLVPLGALTSIVLYHDLRMRPAGSQSAIR